VDQEALAVEAIDLIAAESGASGLRALHAKGTLCAATFTASPEASRLSCAPHLAGGGALRAHVRFSNGSGAVGADYAPREGRGMAVKVYLPGGGTTDIVAVSLPAFFVRTPEAFMEFVHARQIDPATGEPDPERVTTFLDGHPEALTALGAVFNDPTDSYLTLAYNALHTYLFEDAGGTVTPIRYHLEPEGGLATVPAEEAAGRDPDHLQTDLATRLAEGPARFDITVSIAGDGDVLDDPTVVWPEDRERVVIGHIDITGTADDRERDGDVLVFDPTRVTDGIALSDDQILQFRRTAYSESVLRRSGLHPA
jgi:catalase